MEDLRRELHTLIRRMEAAVAPDGSVEEETLHRLQALSAAAEKAQQISDLAPLFLDLKDFWLNSIDWCSQLSKDIERLLILGDDLTTNG